jgi:hypothetical protein
MLSVLMVNSVDLIATNNHYHPQHLGSKNVNSRCHDVQGFLVLAGPHFHR